METKLAAEGQTPESPTYWAGVYADLLQKMTPTAADDALGVQAGTVAAAIKRGEIDCYQFSSRKVYVTPRLIAQWAEAHCRKRQEPLPG